MNFINELFQKAFSAFQRFPICMLWAVAGSIYFIIKLAGDAQLFETDFRWDMIFILGVSWLIATAFFVEQFEHPSKYIWVKLLMLVLLGLYCFSLPTNGEDAHKLVMNRWLLLLLAGHVFVFFAPFLRSWDDIAFWNYLKNILIAIGRSAMFSGVLFGGLALALLASDTLFSLGINVKVYAQLFVFCLGIVNTCIYLSDFPKDVQRNHTFVFNKALGVFVKFILLPLLLLYFVILYIYGFKILINWKLPDGWLSGLISVLAIIGFIVQIIINPWRKKSSMLIRKFHPWFYYLLLPILILLFIAVFRRISDYNFTESRYLLMLLSFWILGVCVYSIMAKNAQMRVLPISLFVLILFSAFGPWSAAHVSINAQLTELGKIYNEIESGDKKLEMKKAERFQNIVFYLSQRKELDKIEQIIGFNLKEHADRYSGWMTGREILDSLGVEILSTDNIAEFHDQFFSFYKEEATVMEGHPFSGFAELNYGSARIADSTLEMIMEWEGSQLSIHKQGEHLLSLSMDSLLKSNLRNQHNRLIIDPKKLEFDLRNENGRFKLIFSELSFYVKEEVLQINTSRAYLFFSLEEELN